MIDDTAFQAIPAGAVFATGEIIDSPAGANMTGSGKMLRYVAKKGHADDWCVYVHWAISSVDYIKRHGDKIVHPDNILRAVPCTPEVLRKYRY